MEGNQFLPMWPLGSCPRDYTVQQLASPELSNAEAKVHTAVHFMAKIWKSCSVICIKSYWLYGLALLEFYTSTNMKRRRALGTIWSLGRYLRALEAV
jgi:hypothetical protein